MRREIVSSLALLVAIACASSQPSETVNASETSDAASAFVGSWTLASWTRTSSDGETVHPYGEDAFGRILYQPNGKMSVVLMRHARPDVPASERTPEEMRAVLGGFFAYSGGYTVDEDAGTVTHHVEACIAPDWVGRDQVRHFELLSHERLALRPPPNVVDGVERRSELVWQRER